MRAYEQMVTSTGEQTFLQLCLVTWPLNESEAGVDLVIIVMLCTCKRRTRAENHS